MTKKYYYNSEVYGEIYNWNKIFDLFDKLKVPDTVWKPRREQLKSKYSVLLSTRSIGKTSNILLLGLCQRALYNTQVCYVRATELEFTPTEAKRLVSVLNSFEGGRYIKQLTKDKYNTIIYRARAFYYANLDKDGNVLEKEADECIKVLTVDKNEEYKSVLNMPRGDFFIFDEFVRTRYSPDEFVRFMDLFMTVSRGRLSPVIFMLANTISNTSPYYSELEIKQYIRKMKVGEHISVETEAGTKIYIELCAIPPKAKEKRAFFNSLFIGFQNPKLGAITGGQLWALPNVPHLYRRAADDIPEYHARNIYLNYEGELLRMDILTDKKSGFHAEVVPSAGEPKDDAIVLVLDPPDAPNEVYLLGGRKRKIRRVILDLISDGRVLFSTNEEGSIFKNYIHRALELERDPLI